MSHRIASYTTIDEARQTLPTNSRATPSCQLVPATKTIAPAAAAPVQANPASSPFLWGDRSVTSADDRQQERRHQGGRGDDVQGERTWRDRDAEQVQVGGTRPLGGARSPARVGLGHGGEVGAEQHREHGGDVGGVGPVVEVPSPLLAAAFNRVGVGRGAGAVPHGTGQTTHWSRATSTSRRRSIRSVMRPSTPMSRSAFIVRRVVDGPDVDLLAECVRRVRRIRA